MPTTILSHYSYGVDCYQEIPQVLKPYKVKTVALIGGKRALESAADEVIAILTTEGYQVLGPFVYGTNSTVETIGRLVAHPDIASADILFGFGGGRALDTVKMVAKQLDKTCMTFPTICSNCSAGTAIAAIYKEDHSLLEYGYPDVPAHIFINTRVIAAAPSQYFWAGIGDGISKAPEVDRAVRHYRQGGKLVPHTGVLGHAIALSSKEAFYQYGPQGLADVHSNQPSQAVEEIALTIIISTAYASNLVNQPDFFFNTCHAHAFYNGTTAVKREGEYLHGAIVAFGVMVLHAYFQETEELAAVAQFNQSLGLPTTLDQIGLTPQDLPTVIQLAVQTNEYKHTPFEADRFEKAILEADQFGRRLHQTGH